MSKTIKLFKEIKAELALDDVEEGNLIQTGAEESAESTGREIVAFWNWDRKNYLDRKSTRLNSSHVSISYAVFCLKKKKKKHNKTRSENTLKIAIRQSTTVYN